ncbi:hypothetical protein PS6_005100 [Mucor atramentarius]
MKKYPNVAISEGCYSLIRSIFQIKGTPLPSYMLDIPEFAAITVPIQTCQHVRVQQHDLKYDWHKLMKQQDSNTTTHEQAFLVICWHLQSKCLVTIPQPPSEANEKSGFDGLEERIRQKVAKNDVAKCQLWCIFSIRNRASFWKSTLKVVVQFMDLWIRSNSQDTKVLIKNLCQIFEMCIANVHNKDDLIHFRDDIIKQRLEADDIHLPTFGSIDLWNIPFKSDLIKVCNQITIDDDDNGGLYGHDIPEDVILKLIKVRSVLQYVQAETK